MKIDPYLHAALVLHGAGKEISKENLLSVLRAAGVSPDEAKAQVLSEAVKGVNFEELLKSAAVPVAQPVAGSSQAQSGGEQKKEEKKEDHAKQEQAAAEGLAALFG